MCVPVAVGFDLLLQKKIIRIITNSSYQSHSRPLFSLAKQLTISDLNKLLIATFMYRLYKNCLPSVFQEYFCMNSTLHGYSTRGSNKLHISYARTDVMRSQLRIAGPKLWNTIDPAIINNSKHWRSFKQNYKNHLLAMYMWICNHLDLIWCYIMFHSLHGYFECFSCRTRAKSSYKSPTFWLFPFFSNGINNILHIVLLACCVFVVKLPVNIYFLLEKIKLKFNFF